jgi:hypothetical protein
MWEIVTEKDLVMMIDKPDFVVKLYKDLLEVDLKKGIKKELEDFLESRPFLKENLGFLFQTVVPIDVLLKDIKSATVDREFSPGVIALGWARAKIVIPRRKDLIIPLEPDECKKLIDKLNELIPTAKKKKP